MLPEERARQANYCFGCGGRNPEGLHLDVQVKDFQGQAIYRSRPEHQGFPGILHGGIIATLLDEVMGWVMADSAIWAVTARMDLRFRRPVPLGGDLLVDGQLTRNRGRLLQTRGRVFSLPDRELLVESDATFMRVPPDRARELDELYRDLLASRAERPRAH